jgi:hypothetical protein
MSDNNFSDDKETQSSETVSISEQDWLEYQYDFFLENKKPKSKVPKSKKQKSEAPENESPISEKKTSDFQAEFFADNKKQSPNFQMTEKELLDFQADFNTGKGAGGRQAKWDSWSEQAREKRKLVDDNLEAEHSSLSLSEINRWKKIIEQLEEKNRYLTKEENYNDLIEPMWNVDEKYTDEEIETGQDKVYRILKATQKEYLLTFSLKRSVANPSIVRELHEIVMEEQRTHQERLSKAKAIIAQLERKR